MEGSPLVPESKSCCKDPFHICLIIQIILSIGVLAVLVTFAVFLSDKVYIVFDGAGWTVFLWIVTLLFVASNVVTYVSITKCGNSHKTVFLWINIILPAITILLGLGFGIPKHGQTAKSLDIKAIKYMAKNPKDYETALYISKMSLDEYKLWLNRRTYLSGDMVFSFISVWGVYELVFIIWVNCCKVGKDAEAEFP